MNTIDSVLDFAHLLAGRAVSEGDVAVDATVGNGHDTVALAEAVGATGHVFGFDVQREALENASERLAAAGLEDRVTLLQEGHEEMVRHLPEVDSASVAAITFNLGYLPGSSSDLTTQPDTTLSALDDALELLREGGVVTIVAYTGHDGGAEEANRVEQWASELPQSPFSALSYTFVNQVNDPPRLVAVEKRAP